MSPGPWRAWAERPRELLTNHDQRKVHHVRVLVLGGDGYLGWPQALHLSAAGHEVHLMDNLARRRFDAEHGFDTLVPIASIEERVHAWGRHSGEKISIHLGDITDHERLVEVVRAVAPHAVVHYGEQRSAPYSMIDRDHAVHTQVNNVVGTLNLLFALAEEAPDAHLVKLGTMGEYGTPDIDIEEGFIEIRHNGRSDKLPFPKQPGSFYHLSKVHDSHNIMFACRAWGLRATDLNQGIVYGCTTPQTSADPALATRLDYDHVYGTALNRFCVQAIAGRPITVYGAGGQTRGYINIVDTMRCIELAVDAPPAAGEFRVFNQITESFALNDLAAQVARVARESGHAGVVEHIDNPRVEAEQHYYNVVHTRLESLGLRPHLLDDGVVADLLATVERHRERIDPDVIMPVVNWRARRNDVGGAR